MAWWWPFRRKGPKEKAEKETRTELSHLQTANKSLQWGWGFIVEQLKFEKNAPEPHMLHSSAAIGTHYRDSLPKFDDTIRHLEEARKNDQRLRKIVHSFLHVVGSDNLEETVGALLKMFDELLAKVRKIRSACEENRKRGEQFDAEYTRKGRTHKNYDPSKLLEEFKTRELDEECLSAHRELEDLIRRVEHLLSLEEHLPSVSPEKRITMAP